MASTAGMEGLQENVQSVKGESQREREFYRYFEPIRRWTANGPKFCDLNNDASINAHEPVSSPDPALTAFCQLGALRCGTRRAMLFFFDKQFGYILAEATRSLSLHDASIQDIEDSIWLGHAKIPRGYSVCEKTTLHLQPQSNESDTDESEKDLIHIINDLREDTGFCDRPYVTGGPRARFYAGVPIRTSRGINIGAYCILDDRPREGLKESEVRFLRDMGATVMQHLEMVRAKSQAERASRMVAGLGSFVDGATVPSRDLDEGTPQNSCRSSVPSGLSSTRHSPPGRVILDAKDSEVSPRNSTVASSEHQPFGKPPEAPTPTEEAQTPQSVTYDSSSRRAEDLRAELISSNVRKTFERAVGVLRDAVQLDGAMFIDATPSSYGSLVEDERSEKSQTNSDTAHSSTDEARAKKARHSAAGSPNESKPSPVCGVLAASYRPHPRYGQADVGMHIDEKFLKKLLRRYPRGKVWNFSAEGVSSSDDDHESHTSGGNSSSPNVPQAHATQNFLPRRKKNRKASRLEDGKRLAQQFPGVRSLAISGIYNQMSGRWHAASIAWTYDHYRLLTEDLDMPFLKAFSDVLMVEVHRLEAQRSDRAKVDFISSISHELRSPLHGILGSVECIQEQGTDNFTESLVAQVETCGKNLLDIVNNLLDFSKINYYGRATEKRLKIDRQKQLSTASTTPSLGSMMALDSEVSLDVVTEEIMDSTFYSFCCSKERQKVLDRSIAIILDIQRGSDVDWWCRIALGGWKRILMNLVSNALKYTHEGYIQVSLRREAGSRKKRGLVLTVKDTGQGMSRAFLQDRLFSAFAQEDSFAEGTGLGMNLVATIVKTLGGKIEVQSEQRVGTTVVVQLPFEQVKPRRNSADESHDPVETQDLEGLVLGMPSVTGDTSIGTHRTPIQGAAHVLLTGSIVKTCSELGVRTVSLNHGQPDADVLFATEDQISSSDLASTRTTRDTDLEMNVLFGGSRSERPLILLFDSATRMRDFGLCHPELLKSRRVELISQPAGPERISKAIRACMTTRGSQPTPYSRAGAEQKETSHECQTAGQEAVWIANIPYHTLSKLHRPSDSRLNEVSEGGKVNPALLNGDHGTQNSIRPAAESSRDSGEDHPKYSEQAQSTSTTDKPLESKPSAPDRSRTDSPSAPNSGVTLMVVDDNAINLQLLTTYANRNGHQHIRACNGQHAIDAYKATCSKLALPPDVAAIQATSNGHNRTAPDRPAVILMDINMPIMNGYEATRGIRSFERSLGLSPATIVALTGLGSASAQQEAYASGVDLFLTKPVRLKELGKILEGVERPG